MPGIPSTDAERILTAAKSDYHKIIHGETEAGPHIRLQVDDFIYAEFAGLKDGQYTTFSTLLNPARFKDDAALLEQLEEGADLIHLNMPNIDEGASVRNKDGIAFGSGLNASEAQFINEFTRFSEELVDESDEEEQLVTDAAAAVTYVCMNSADVFENPRTPTSREIIRSVIDALADEFEAHVAYSPQLQNRRKFIANLRQLSAGIKR